MKRHVILVGLPGAGKTTVGRLVAHQLDSPFIDIDEQIIAALGKTVAAIFAAEGEARFRELERAYVRQALQEAPAVLAPGGGWAAQPGVLDDVGNRALLIHLETAAAIAAQRVAGQGGRPLLGGDPVHRMEVLLAERKPAYERADFSVRTDERTAAEVAREVARLARSKGGW